MLKSGNRKRILSVMLCMLLALSVAGCAGSGKSASPSGAAGTAGKVLKVAMELAYPPFETKDLRGDPSGVSVDLAKDLGKYLGMEVKIENIAWAGLIPALQTGQADLVISSMTITEERKKTIDFSDPYAKALLALLVNKDSTVKAAADLNEPGKVTVVKNGTTGFTYAQNNLTRGTVRVLSDVSACVTEVMQGKADAFIYDQLTIYQNHQQFSDSTRAVYIPFQQPEEWGVALKKGNDELLQKVNAFLKQYKTSNGYAALTEKYLKKEKEEFDRLGFQFFFGD